MGLKIIIKTFRLIVIMKSSKSIIFKQTNRQIMANIMVHFLGRHGHGHLHLQRHHCRQHPLGIFLVHFGFINCKSKFFRKLNIKIDKLNS